MRSRRTVTWFALPMALAAIVSTSTGAAVAAPPSAPSPVPTGVPYTHGTYVAMGDSRAAGGPATLTADYQLNPCRRSGDNYPAMVRDRIRPRQFIDISCIGAESAHLRTYPQVMGVNLGSTGPVSFAIAPQLGRVPSTAQVISVSTGGNDLGWATMLQKCNARANPDCRKNPRQRARADRGLHRLSIQAGTTLRAIRAKAPQAQIFAVGVGGFIGTRGCRRVQLRQADAEWFRELFTKANDRLRTATEAVGGTFIDVTDPGHDACSGQPWFYGRYGPDGNMAFHMNTAGRIVVANRIAGSIRR